MDTGFGVDPEIRVVTNAENQVTVVLSKTFRGAKSSRQFSIIQKVINRNFEEEIKAAIEYNIEVLQSTIDEEADDTCDKRN